MSVSDSHKRNGTMCATEAARVIRRFPLVVPERQFKCESPNAWSDERTERLKDMWAAGRSASQIASNLGGITRNAVIGKVHRLGLSGRVTISRMKSLQPRCTPAEYQRAKHRAQTRAATSQTAAKKRKAMLDNLFRSEPLPPAHEIDVPRIALMDLEPNHCRWPAGDPVQGFCGCNTVPGLSYCLDHARRSMATTQPKTNTNFNQRFFSSIEKQFKSDTARDRAVKEFTADPGTPLKVLS